METRELDPKIQFFNKKNKPEKSFSPEARDTVTSNKDQQGITERSM